MKALTYKEAQTQEQVQSPYRYDENRWEYRKDGTEYLVHVIDGEPTVVAEGDYVHSYDLKRWEYRKDGILHEGTLEEFLANNRKTNSMNNLENEINKILSQKKADFIQNYTNTCEKCKVTAKNKFCSRSCYQKSKFDWRSAYASIAPEIAFKYFKINPDQENEFKSFLNTLGDLYY